MVLSKSRPSRRLRPNQAKVRSTTPGLRCPTIPPGPRQTCSISTGPGRQVATTSHSAANAAGASDHSAFDKNALLRFGLYVWIGKQNASVNNLRLRGPSRIVSHGLFRPKSTILCLSSYRSAVTSQLSDNPGPRRKTGQHDCRTGEPIGDSRGGPGTLRAYREVESPHQACRRMRSMSPVETRRQRPGFSAGMGAGRQVGRDAPSPKTSLRADAVGALG
jgi:hypothetical protein